MNAYLGWLGFMPYTRPHEYIPIQNMLQMRVENAKHTLLSEGCESAQNSTKQKLITTRVESLEQEAKNVYRNLSSRGQDQCFEP